MPSGNRPFPCKKWGRGQISRDTCSAGNHLLEESKSHKTVCFRHFLLDPKRGGGGRRGGGGGGGRNVCFVVPFLFHTHTPNAHTYIHTLTVYKNTVAVFPRTQLCPSTLGKVFQTLFGLMASAERADLK